MDLEKVAFPAQNKLLAKLAPMKRVMVERWPHARQDNGASAWADAPFLIPAEPT